MARTLFTLLLLAVAGWACLEAAPGEPAEAAARISGVLPPDDGRVPQATRRDIIEKVGRRFEIAPTAAGRLVGFMAGLSRGDLGRSWRDGRPVVWHLGRALPVTMGLMGASLLVAYGLGLVAALAAAAWRDRVLDRVITAAGALALAVPPAWAAVVGLHLLGTGRPGILFSPSGYLLPTLCLAYVVAALVARHGRASLIDALGQPFAQAARARGASDSRILWIHASRAAAAPLVALLATSVSYFLGAALVVERAFDLRGIGALIAAERAIGDAPVVLGATLTAGALVAIASLAADVLQRVADPRLGHSG